jgi:pyrroline-5-carboxylate reductase
MKTLQILGTGCPKCNQLATATEASAAALGLEFQLEKPEQQNPKLRMTTKTIGFIGGGRVTRIILGGLNREQKLPAHIVVSDPNPATLAKLNERFPQISPAPGDNLKAAAQDIVFLAVHPPAIGEAAGQIKGALRPDAIVVSLAPKFTIAKLSELLGGFQRIVRVIPNAPSIIGAGHNPMTFAATLTPVDQESVTSMFAVLGDHPEVAESKLEGYALLTGMGPTYLWFQMQTLRELAESFGLTEAEVTPALKRTVCGAARTLLESGLPAAEVMDLIPVKPLSEMEASVTEMYRSRLPALFQKIKP